MQGHFGLKKCKYHDFFLLKEHYVVAFTSPTSHFALNMTTSDFILCMLCFVDLMKGKKNTKRLLLTDFCFHICLNEINLKQKISFYPILWCCDNVSMVRKVILS